MCYKGMQMQNTPVKYLGTFVGSGDLSHLNFDLTLRKAWKIVSRWNKRNLSLPARVLVSKTFIFSTFIHVCNCAFITTAQVELLQKILNEFLWHGRNKIRPMVMYAPVLQWGLNMINIKNVLSTLHVKCIDRLCKDAGLSWLRLIWPKILGQIPPTLISGLMGITEPTLHSLSPFYCSTFQSFVYVNDLIYSQN